MASGRTRTGNLWFPSANRSPLIETDTEKIQERNTDIYVDTNANINKGPLFGLKQFLTIEIPLKMMKIACYFISKALFVLENV